MHDETTSKLNPPREAMASVVLNGASNGGMITGLTRVAYLLTKGHSLTDASKNMSTVFWTVGGTALGLAYGWYEANRMQDYREAIRDEFKHQDGRLAALEASHGARVAKASAQAEPAPTR